MRPSGRVPNRPADLAVSVLFWACLTLGIGAARAATLEYLPLDHPAYRDLENLWTRGVIDSLDLAARPWSRHEIAAALHVAAARTAAPPRDPVLRRMLREFALEVSWFDPEPLYRESPVPVQVGGTESSLRVLPGVAFTAAGNGFGKLGFEPRSRAFVQFEWFGRPNLYVTTEVVAQRVEPDRLAGDTLIKDTNLLVDSEEAYVSFSSRHVDLLFGLTETRWGPGRTGTLLLSEAAVPLAMLRVEGTVANRLELRAVTAALSQPGHQYLAAHRATFHVSRTLSIGVSESARYDAETPGLLYLMSVVPYTVVHKIQARNLDGAGSIDPRNNVMMGADVNWRARPGWRLFAEFLLDDLATESGGMPNRMAFQLGVDHARLFRGVPVSVLLEMTKVLRYTYATFYDRDYIVDGHPLGYAQGPDTENLHLEASADPAMNWSFTLEMDLRRRGQGVLGEFWDVATPEDPWGTLKLDGPVERSVLVDAGVRWVPRDEVWAGVRTGYRWRTNAEGADGADDGDWRAGVSLYWRF